MATVPTASTIRFCPPSEPDKYYFDADEADRWCAWIEKYACLVDGNLFESVKLMDWHRAVIRELFGWKRVEDDMRRYSTFFIFVPRKNAKTWLLAMIMLGLACIDGEKGAQVYIAAADEKQAKVMYMMMATQIEHWKTSEDPQLRMFGAQFDAVAAKSKDQQGGVIIHVPTKSFVEVLTSRPKGKTGFNVHGYNIDELHEQTDDRLREALRTGTVNRRQPIGGATTTAGEDIYSPAYEEYEYAKKVRDGVIVNDSYLAVIFEPDPGDDLDDPATWQKVNPGWGVTVNEKTLRKIYNEALGSPTKMAKFYQFHLNKWVSKSQTWINLDDWDACKGEFDEKTLAGLDCYAGLDLASVRDSNSLVLLFPFSTGEYEEIEELIKNEDGEVMSTASKTVEIVRAYTLQYFWVPEKTVKNRYDQGFSYPQWIEAGWMKQTKGAAADLIQIAEDIKAIHRKFKIKMLGEDEHQAYELNQNLKDAGIEIVEVAQSFPSLSAPTKKIETMVLKRRLLHNGNAVMRWHISNAKAETNRREEIMLTKDKSGKNKIDGCAALVNATKVWIGDPKLPELMEADVW
jgi:phage terminase large subunit-like protein